MKRGRDEDEGEITEESVGIMAYCNDAVQPRHPTGIFQMRWQDFHVRELSMADGSPLALTAPPEPDVPQADVVSFTLVKENRTTADALLQLASASGCPLNAFAVAGSKDRRAVTVQRVTARGLRDTSKLLRINEKFGGAGSSRVQFILVLRRSCVLPGSLGVRGGKDHRPRRRCHAHRVMISRG